MPTATDDREAWADYVLNGCGGRTNPVPGLGGSAFPSAQAIADQASDAAPIVIGLDLGRQPDLTAYSLVRDGRVSLVGVDLDEADLAKIRDGRLSDLRIRIAGDPE